VCLNNIIGYTLHTEYLNIQAGSIRQRILDDCEGLFVDLGHMDGQTYYQR